MTIKTAHAKTCGWLLNNDQYLNWLDTSKLKEHHGFLWIKGKAGTGKSTLMKFALVQARKTMKGVILLSFFFNARGDGLEKSTTGLYRSILVQLFDKLPVLRNILDSLTPSTLRHSKDNRWETETLKELLEQAIQSLENSSVVCFVDALDECDEVQIRDMIQFLQHISESAVSRGICFHVCLSSRHYPNITLRNGLSLVLEGLEGHSQDITTYVESELNIGKSESALKVRAELQEKASGIFMWVVLVVAILNRESDRGKTYTLRQKLREIPGDLHQLFHDILTRDSHDKAELVLCIQWVLFASRPISPEELFHAIHVGTDPEVTRKWKPEHTMPDTVKLFILNSSKGLVEITVSSEPTVQFIHKSVNDYLLERNGLGRIWPEFESKFQGQGHERLKQCCLKYIGVYFAARLDVSDEDLSTTASNVTVRLQKSVARKFPFLEYAAQSLLFHAEEAEDAGISQANFLNNFQPYQWARLHHLFEDVVKRKHRHQGHLAPYGDPDSSYATALYDAAAPSDTLAPYDALTARLMRSASLRFDLSQLISCTERKNHVLSAESLFAKLAHSVAVLNTLNLCWQQSHGTGA
jgi:hypothetical protein